MSFLTTRLGEHTSDHVFIDVDSERFVDLLCDSRASEAGITSSPKAPTVGSIQQ